MSTFCRLNSTSSLTIVSATYVRGVITVETAFSGKINREPANFTVSINSSTFISSTYTVSFNIKADGLSFSSINNVQAIKAIKKVFNAFALIIVMIFLLSLLVHKMLGVEMLISYQLITLVHSINKN
jgi:hypothetical protein